MVATEAPHLVKGQKVVLGAPGGVLAPLSIDFWYHVLMPMITNKSFGFDINW